MQAFLRKCKVLDTDRDDLSQSKDDDDGDLDDEWEDTLKNEDITQIEADNNTAVEFQWTMWKLRECMKVYYCGIISAALHFLKLYATAYRK